MNLREVSKQNYGSSAPNTTFDEIKVGSLQRIADATEMMARRYEELIRERDQYKRWYEDAARQSQERERSITSLRGVITKLKQRLQSIDPSPAS